LIKPVSGFLVPIFFVLMGLKVDLRGLGGGQHLGLALVVVAVAILGKQACALGGLGTSLDKLTLGIGMIPRGEVGLIFANMGLGLTIGGQPIIDSTLYSIVVFMVLVTTVVTPPALKWSLGRAGRPSP
jgi:Kef-type K+ transport system membrane component KefB